MTAVDERPRSRPGDEPDLDGALRRADAALRDGRDPTARARGALALAALLPQRGLLARSADLHRWVAEHAPAAVTPTAAVALLGVGALDEGRRAADRPTGDTDLPDLRDTVGALVAEGLLASVDDHSGTALSLLLRASTALAACDDPGPLPDSPAALGALLALHRGEPELAEPVLDLALDTGLGGPGLRRRHLLLRGWASLLRDDEAGARTALTAAADGPTPLEPRDELVAVALEVALARRAGDVRRLLDLWSRARQALLRHPVDLYALLPVGELAIAAARLGESRWVAPHVADAAALLDALGAPASWSTAWHWAGLHAAITADDDTGARAHADALTGAATTNDRAVVPARAAGVWLRVRAGDIDADEVTEVAQGLRAAGLGWDGARLAGEAAIRTTDRRASTALLACARTLAPGAAGPAGPAADADAAEPATDPRPGETLTPRERDIAALVLEGLTYRDIAGRLFLSAKTVEHHVARIRQRLGSASRAELFADLRTALDR